MPVKSRNLEKNFLTLLTFYFFVGCNSEGENISSNPPLNDINHPSIETETNTSIELQYRKFISNNEQYFEIGKGVSSAYGVPFDSVEFIDGKPKKTPLTNSSAIGLYINYLVNKIKNGDESSIVKLRKVMKQLKSAPKWEGLFYWFYKLDDGALKVFGSYDSDYIVSAVDNGNIFMSLATLIGALSDSRDPQLIAIVYDAESIVTDSFRGWNRLFDPARGLIRAGYNTNTKAWLNYYLDRKVSESRSAVLFAVLHGYVPSHAFTNMELNSIIYTLSSGEQYETILSWYGSFFELLVPTLWIDEKELMSKEFYNKYENFIRIHKGYSDKYGVGFLGEMYGSDGIYYNDGHSLTSESSKLYNNRLVDSRAGAIYTLASYYDLDNDYVTRKILNIKNNHPDVVTDYGWLDAVYYDGDVSTKMTGYHQGIIVNSIYHHDTRKYFSNYLRDRNLYGFLESLYSSGFSVDYQHRSSEVVDL
ncbi:glucoamylase family protein [Vibrio sp. T11.5]|uniref:glucoamylase family protein n=1 Tax=Vibrio sp. T11.5 TaxID=2998836 RepID=UPI0022CD9754|nr:glucoamylase family protein [Vibrio sp. T11.5]MDA0118565.1 hypothetical protein [Vibrio sp. T11.5]